MHLPCPHLCPTILLPLLSAPAVVLPRNISIAVGVNGFYTTLNNKDSPKSPQTITLEGETREVLLTARHESLGYNDLLLDHIPLVRRFGCAYTLERETEPDLTPWFTMPSSLTRPDNRSNTAHAESLTPNSGSFVGQTRGEPPKTKTTTVRAVAKTPMFNPLGRPSDWDSEKEGIARIQELEWWKQLIGQYKKVKYKSKIGEFKQILNQIYQAVYDAIYGYADGCKVVHQDNNENNASLDNILSGGKIRASVIDWEQWQNIDAASSATPKTVAELVQQEWKTKLPMDNSPPSKYKTGICDV